MFLKPIERGTVDVVILILGILFAFLRDWIDPTVKGSYQAARLTGLPVISEIPP